MIKILIAPNSTIKSQEILYFYNRYGTNLFKHLKLIEYAFILYDNDKKTIISAISPGSITKTIFYHQNKNNFYIAFSMQELQNQIRIKLQFNKNKLDNCLILNGTNEDIGFFKNIYRLPVGNRLVFTKGKIKIKAFNNFKNKTLKKLLPITNKESYYRKFERVITKAIEKHLTPGVKIASHLSGGLDSSSITCITAKILAKRNERLVAIGAVPQGSIVGRSKKNWNLNDISYMNDVINQYDNIDFIPVTKPAISTFDIAKIIFKYADAPSISPENIGWIAETLKQAKQAQAPTILTGFMGNFTISWKGKYVNSLPSRLYFKIKKLAPNIYKHYFYNKNNSSFEKKNSLSWFQEHSLLNKKNKSNIKKPGFLKREWITPKTNASFFEKNNILTDVCGLYQLLEQEYGVRIIDPTFDPEVVEFCLSTPNHIFCHGPKSQQKRMLIRESMHGILPESIRTRTSRGVQSADWFIYFNNDYEKWCNMFTSACKYNLVQEIFDLERIQKLLEEWPKIDLMNLPQEEFEQTEFNYKIMLLRALHIISWMQLHYESGNVEN
jgi:asparagine synthase (glutamine-hydrolysing)